MEAIEPTNTIGRQLLFLPAVMIVPLGVAFGLLAGLSFFATTLAPGQAAAIVATVSVIVGAVCAGLGVTLLWSTRIVPQDAAVSIAHPTAPPVPNCVPTPTQKWAHLVSLDVIREHAK
jgi:hypothetical protein